MANCGKYSAQHQPRNDNKGAAHLLKWIELSANVSAINALGDNGVNAVQPNSHNWNAALHRSATTNGANANPNGNACQLSARRNHHGTGNARSARPARILQEDAGEVCNADGDDADGDAKAEAKSKKG